jgi:hypothetical protein
VSNSTTATVETLTAEVRVLIVDSRQVTLSVYGQLDEVPCTDIEPFGRVRPRDAEQGRVYIVGRDKESGALVRSSAWIWDMVREPSVREMADQRRPVSKLIYMDLSELAWVAHPGNRYAGQAGGPVRVKAEAEIARRDAQREWMAEYGQDWETLPLVVLAGLR